MQDILSLNWASVWDPKTAITLFNRRNDPHSFLGAFLAFCAKGW